MSEGEQLSRREFAGRMAAAGAVGASAPYFVSARALGGRGAPGANGKIHLGLIGCGGMGRSNLRNCAMHADVAVTAACDVQPKRLEAAVNDHGGSAKPHRDWRELLARDDVDAVIIATPPHWHALQSIEACRAGKDIYLQKPMTLHLGESLALNNAVAKHNRVSQIGTSIHASQNYRRIVEYVRSGNLGRISVVRAFNAVNQGPDGIGFDPSTTVPEGVDWEMWIGPASMRPYHRKLAADSYNHSSFMDYSGGWLAREAPHIIDLPIWALDLDYPDNTSCGGGRFVIRDDGDAPDVQEVLWQYPSVVMTWMGMLTNSYGFDLHGRPGFGRRLGVYFHGLNGTLYGNFSMYKIVPEGRRLGAPAPPKPWIPPSPGHEREWLDCIKTRMQPSCSVSYHSKVDVPIALANLSLRLGRSIRFNPATRKIVGDEEAARLAVPVYRDPWRFPKEYLES